MICYAESLDRGLNRICFYRLNPESQIFKDFFNFGG